MSGAFADIATPIMSGILLGGLYTVIALGLSLVFGVMKLINVAHGDLVIFGSYFAYAMLAHVGVDPIVSLLLGIPVLFGVGFAIQKFLMAPVFRISMEAPLIIAFGISLILENVFQIVFTPLSRGLTTSYSLQSIQMGELYIPVVYLLNFGVAIVVMLGLGAFLKKTYLGQAIIAASQDTLAAQLMGINTERLFAITFGISAAVSAVAGVFLGLTFPFTPVSGIPFLIIAFGVVILGGLGSILGTFLGGIILGLSQTLSAHFIGASEQMLVVYVMVLVVLAVRPQGLFGR
ncbi:MAG: branched-chain amino acid ABC transporter permease [Deltaproteobacteria bacterium HGW-Deltaproteobacteria-21]|jgi:branched-chain amino acid transport system permease protein|nr:MAG: branched-chain amino acid ABC transporter permease [Deltaproteobacteria bacterium HGW-Deltaproteobacteria-21]